MAATPLADRPIGLYTRNGVQKGVVAHALAAGGAAGAIAVTGPAAIDHLVSVIRHKPAVAKQTVLAGGAAGNHTVTGIATTDRLVSVIHVVGTAAPALTAMADITDEFTISAADTINNAAGTATTNGYLLVTYETPGAVVDLTDEFTISDDDEIDNTSGTATTGSTLAVTYITR